MMNEKELKKLHNSLTKLSTEVGLNHHGSAIHQQLENTLALVRSEYAALYKKGDSVICIKKYIREDDESTPYPNESCIVSDIDGDSISLEGYNSFYPKSYFKKV